VSLTKGADGNAAGGDLLDSADFLAPQGNAARFSEVDQLCNCIASFVGDDVSKVDTVLWRFATLDRNYLARFTACIEGNGYGAKGYA